MRRALRFCALCAITLAEPVLHGFGLAHPEGLSALGVNMLMTATGEDA